MAQLGCRCGERMYTSDDPCPYMPNESHSTECISGIPADLLDVEQFTHSRAKTLAFVAKTVTLHFASTLT